MEASTTWPGPAKAAWAAVALLLAATAAPGQECYSGEVASHEAFLYGRFEVRIQSAAGDGVVSSFFLYNLDVGCNWPDENNEIDIEMTGNRSESVQFTTHYPGPVFHTRIVPVDFDPHAGLHTYAIEWTPGRVQWFVDGVLAYTQDERFVQGLVHPMRIMMNLWAVDSPGWAGTWTGRPLPLATRYEHVSFARYTPGAGDTGTNDDFTHEWTDPFDHWDHERWAVSGFRGFNGNFCTFVPQGVSVSAGRLHLEMTEPIGADRVPVTFQVAADSLTLAPTDRLYVNGGFNNWDGWSLPLSDGDSDGIWTRTVDLLPGRYEYIVTRNGWSETGGAPLGSVCDFLPCDQWANYGLVVPIGSAPITIPPVCWATCEVCPTESASACAADVNADRAVTAADVIALLGDFGCEASLCAGDVDRDRHTRTSDRNVLLEQLLESSYPGTCLP